MDKGQKDWTAKERLPSYKTASSTLFVKADGAVEYVGPFGVLIHVLHLDPGVYPLSKFGKQNQPIPTCQPTVDRLSAVFGYSCQKLDHSVEILC